MKKRYHYRLIGRMHEKGVTRFDALNALSVSAGYWNERVHGRRDWQLCEVYKLCDMLEIPAAEMREYFPAA